MMDDIQVAALAAATVRAGRDGSYQYWFDTILTSIEQARENAEST